MSTIGRKGKSADWLTEDGLALIEGWARDGLTDEQIFENIGIASRTFYEWKEKFPQFAQALKKGKAPVDYHVENALYKKATGYTITLKKPMKVKTKKQITGKGEITEERIEYVDEEVYIAPDTTAQIFWLKNRRPDKWRDKVEQVQGGQTNELLQSLLDLERSRL